MAEFLFKDMVKKAGREHEFIIQSSAVSSEEIFNGIGSPVYPPVKKLLLGLARGSAPNSSRKRMGRNSIYFFVWTGATKRAPSTF